jgi:hypothetical protein
VKNGRLILIAAALASLAGPRTVLAHHGQVEYDETSVTVKGTVKAFAWSNPHCVLSIVARNDRGTPQEWHAEILPPRQMVRAGWTPRSVKVGEEVSMTGRPGKNGERIMWLEYVVLPDGQRLGREVDSH